MRAAVRVAVTAALTLILKATAFQFVEACLLFGEFQFPAFLALQLGLVFSL